MASRYSNFERSAIRKSSVVIPNSEATRLDLESRYSAPSDWDCEVIHWGIDTSLFVPMHPDSESETHSMNETRKKYGISDGGNMLLAVGRLAARKGAWPASTGFLQGCRVYELPLGHHWARVPKRKAE